VCGRPTALYSPSGVLQTDRRAVSPDGRFYATSAGVFTAAGALVFAFTDAKGFDWHPQVSGRFALMLHFNPPQPRASVIVHQIGPGGAVPVAGARSDQWHHYLAWADDEQIALGGEASCTTVARVRPTQSTTPTPMPL
jgi:hypothetical protein